MREISEEEYAAIEGILEAVDRVIFAPVYSTKLVELAFLSNRMAHLAEIRERTGPRKGEP